MQKPDSSESRSSKRSSKNSLETASSTGSSAIASSGVADTAVVGGKCAQCVKSICCNSINQQIDAPKSKSDFDHLLWQVSHKNINVFKDADGWFLHIYSQCEHLGDHGICQIYDTRPLVCREYDNDFCEFDEPIPEAAQYFFENYAQLDEHCRKKFKKWDKRFEKKSKG